MNEMLRDYKKRKYLESKKDELARRYGGRVPDDYEEVAADLRKEYRDFLDNLSREEGK